MSDRLARASQAFTALLAAADRVGLVPPEHHAEVFHELAFYGVSFDTIFHRLAEACTEALATTPESDLPQLANQQEELVAYIRDLLTSMSEEASYLTIQTAGQVSGMLAEGQWQHVFRALATKLIWVILNEDSDGSV